jgi:uncharacterized protein (DUF2141 family)
MMKAICFTVTAIFLISASPARSGNVSVVIGGAIPNGTRVFVALCSGSLEPGSCIRGDSKIAQSPTLKFVFGDVPPARYALAAFQDLNGNGSLERSKLGLPLEPYALTNDVGRSRKPTFESAAVSIGPGGREFQLRLRPINRPADQ